DNHDGHVVEHQAEEGVDVAPARPAVTRRSHAFLRGVDLADTVADGAAFRKWRRRRNRGNLEAGSIMSDTVTLIGLDFGTTTSSAVVPTARLLRNAVTGRTELSQVSPRFRSEMVFTPLDNDRIDVGRAEAYLDSWLTAGGVRTEAVFGGGALLTGLTAQQE